MRFSRFFISAILISAAVLPAQLSFAKRERADVEITERKRQKTNAQAEAKTGKKKFDKNEAFLVAVEGKLTKGIYTTISYLTKTAKSLPKKSAQRLDFLQKILNLNIEVALYEYSSGNRKYDKEWDNWDRGGRKGPEPKLNESKAKVQWQKVAEIATAILAEYPKAKNADEITYHQAVALQFLGKDKESARAYTELIKKYPNSSVTGDAYSALADYFFDRNDFRNAMNNYMQALKFKRSKRYSWSLHKLGWCHYNLGKYSQALQFWKETVKSSRVADSNQARALKEEAMRDMVYAFTELKQIEPAVAYYRANQGQKFIGQFLSLLGGTFADQGNYGEAIKVYKRYQQLEPLSPSAPDTEKEIINLAFELNKLPMVWSELEKFAKMYGPQSAWAEKNKEDKKLYLETQAMIKDQILYYAKVTHKKAQKDGNLNGLAEAMKGYELFLKNYPKAKEVAEVKYLMGDIEDYRKNFRKAGEVYLEICMMGKDKAVIYDPKTGKGDNIHHVSAKYMMEDYYRDFEPQMKAMAKTKADFTKPMKPMSVQAKNFIKGCGYYNKTYPNDKKTVRSCDIAISGIYYATNNKKMAQKYMMVVATKYSDSKEGKNAAENLIPMYKDDRKGLLELAKTFLKIPQYEKGEFGKKLRDLLRSAEIEDIASEKDSIQRAKKYEAQAKKNPKAEDADKLMWNAATDYLKGGAVPPAMAAYAVIIKQYPKSSQTQPAIYQLARLYDKRLEFAPASIYYLMYVQKYPKDTKTAGAFARACELQIASDSPKMIDTCLKFASTYPDGGKPILEKLIKQTDRKKQYGKMAQLITQHYISRFKASPNEKIVALYRIYNAGDGRGAAAQQAANEILGTFSSAKNAISGEALRYVGELVFKRVNPEMNKYKAIGLAGGDVDKLLKAMNKKGQALQHLESVYSEVLKTQDSYWGVAALYQIGYAYELFGDALENPPTIKGAKVEDVKKELSPQVKELRTKAFKFYKDAMENVTKFGVYSAWSVRAVNGYARASGSKISFDEYIVGADLVGAEVSASVAEVVRKGGSE